MAELQTFPISPKSVLPQATAAQGRSVFEERSRKLLERMSLEEKILQVRSAVGAGCGLRDDQPLSVQGIPPKLQTEIMAGLGNIHNVFCGLEPGEQAESINALQRLAVEKSRLGIPLLVHGESLHGWRTIFPQAVGLGATWNPSLVREVFSAVAMEMRSCGYHITYAPVLDLATDPRWGRCQECYGEDPYLVSRMGVAAIEGYQGGKRVERIDESHVIACGKHFAGYGQSDGGRNFAPVNMGPRRLHDEILAPFRAAVAEAGMLGIMAAHHEIDGVPCHANDQLLRVILREQWGFDGLLVSDADDIHRLHVLHGVAQDPIEASAMGLAHRIAVDILHGQAYRRLDQVLRRYPELESALNRIVLDTLITKFRLGLFENPYVDPDRARKVCRQPAFIALAREAARQSITLLKNDDALLPLDPQRLQRLAVIGPNADCIQCGTYGPNIGVTILQGIQQVADGRFQVLYARGCRLTEADSGRFLLEEQDMPGHDEEANPTLVSDEENAPLIAQAVEAASQADVVVLVLGGNNYTGREAFFAANHRGDRDDLELPGSQLRLLEAVASAGKPIVLLLNHGNAVLLDQILPKVQSVVEIWYAGEQTGPAVADVLFGHATPGGKLPVTFPRSTGSVPFVYNQKPSGVLKTPLFRKPGPTLPFGFGLSTTRFELHAPTLSAKSFGPGGSLHVSVQVRNAGDRPGDVVVQLYLRDHVGSVTRPVRQLAGFERVALQPGESRKVRFTVDEQTISFTRLDGSFGPEPGRFTAYVGFDSTAETSVDFVFENAQ